MPPTGIEGWKDSDLNHINPETGVSPSADQPIQTNRPAGDPAGDLEQKVPTASEPTPAAGTSLKLQPIPAPTTTHTT